MMGKTTGLTELTPRFNPGPGPLNAKPHIHTVDLIGGGLNLLHDI
jgi:hypothetical protein